jgi:hypothetical protein
MKTGSLLKNLLRFFFSPNTSGFKYNFDVLRQLPQIVLHVLSRLGVSKSLKIQAQGPQRKTGTAEALYIDSLVANTLHIYRT